MGEGLEVDCLRSRPFGPCPKPEIGSLVPRNMMGWIRLCFVYYFAAIELGAKQIAVSMSLGLSLSVCLRSASISQKPDIRILLNF